MSQMYDPHQDWYDEDDPRCRCNGHGFCPLHGTYTPRVDDQEVQLAVAEASRGRNVAVQTIRKKLER